MRIFKFGGASVKDAEGVKNLVKVLQKTGVNDLVIVISAMGKMTNAFETIVDNYIEADKKLEDNLTKIIDFHTNIALQLFNSKSAAVFNKMNYVFADISTFMIKNSSKDYNFIYDQLVSKGEMLSTIIISEYLNKIGIINTWIDVRALIKTDYNYRNATVNWKQTQANIFSKLQKGTLYITQGFLGADNYGNTTTLGREGSDYTGAIIGFCLNAQNVTIWKDVEGVLNADPRYFDETTLLEQISYKEAIELAFYGASVIHPKTIQPLQNKNIPLFVKSFLNPENKGTMVFKGVDLFPKIPCFIVKKNQILVSISSKDFSFIMENNISEIFNLLHEFKIKMNLIQNSAIRFSVCIDDKFQNFNRLYQKLIQNFKVDYNENVTLITVHNFTEKDISKIEKEHETILKQVFEETIKIIIR